MSYNMQGYVSNCEQCVPQAPMYSAQSYTPPAQLMQSSLYAMVQEAAPVVETISASQVEMPAAYSAKANSYYQAPSRQVQYFTPTQFLAASRPQTRFVDDATQVPEIREAFKATTGKELPDDLVIQICSAKELKRIHEEHGGNWSDGIQGFAINRKPDTSFIFVKENNLDELMVTIGHEIGHVLSAPLPTQQDEEAKAFAFSIAWMEAIKEQNIAGLANCLVKFNPAKNGLHNVAFNFVADMLKKGRKALDVFTQLISREVSIRSIEDVLIHAGWQHQ